MVNQAIAVDLVAKFQWQSFECRHLDTGNEVLMNAWRPLISRVLLVSRVFWVSRVLRVSRDLMDDQQTQLWYNLFIH